MKIKRNPGIFLAYSIKFIASLVESNLTVAAIFMIDYFKAYNHK